MVDTRKLLLQTTELFRYGKFKEAEKILNDTLDKDPNCFEARLEQIRSALYQEKLQEAYKMIGYAKYIKPTDPRLAALQGAWFLESRIYDGAKVALDWADQRMPNISTTQINLAIACRGLDKLLDAENHIKKAIKLNPASEFAHYEYSKILVLLGRVDEAVEELLLALRCNLYFPLALKSLTNLLKLQGKRDLAVLVYEDIVQDHPDFAFAYGQLAVLHEERGDYKRAIPLIEYLANTKNRYIDHLRLGINTFLSGNVHDSKVIFLNLIQRDKNRWEAYYNLAEILLTQSKFDEAKVQFEKAIERVKDLDSKPYTALSALAIRDKDFKTARQYIERALKINPISFEASFNMVVILKSEGKIKEAKSWVIKTKKAAANNLTKFKKIQDYEKTL